MLLKATATTVTASHGRAYDADISLLIYAEVYLFIRNALHRARFEKPQLAIFVDGIYMKSCVSFQVVVSKQSRCSQRQESLFDVGD